MDLGMGLDFGEVTVRCFLVSATSLKVLKPCDRGYFHGAHHWKDMQILEGEKDGGS